MELTFLGEKIIVVGREHFLMESKTRPGEHHSIDLEDRSCSCKGFLCRGSCRHLEVADLLSISITFSGITKP